jgi:uncharacterized tellurite resistance protein B-like protein
MFGHLKKLFAELGEGGKHAGHFGDDDYRLAAAALLVHTAVIDGGLAEVERERLHGVLKQRFALDDAQAGALVAEATEAEQKSIDLFQFTARLNRALDEAGRVRMVEMMWQIVYADGTVSEFEDNLVWRAADLLHVSRDERIALRLRVEGGGNAQ